MASILGGQGSIFGDSWMIFRASWLTLGMFSVALAGGLRPALDMFLLVLEIDFGVVLVSIFDVLGLFFRPPWLTLGMFPGLLWACFRPLLMILDSSLLLRLRITLKATQAW